MWKNLVLALVSSVLALGAAEAVLRLCDHPMTQKSGWRSVARAEELNDLGFRGQRFHAGSTAPIVILLGDSQVEAIDVPFADLPETRLQAHLRRLTGRADLCVFTVGPPLVADRNTLPLNGVRGNHESTSLHPAGRSCSGSSQVPWLVPCRGR